MRVDVTQADGETKSVEVKPGANVKDALDKAGAAVPEDHKVFLDGKEVDLNAKVQQQSVVVVQPEVSGGQ